MALQQPDIWLIAIHTAPEAGAQGNDGTLLKTLCMTLCIDISSTVSDSVA